MMNLKRLSAGLILCGLLATLVTACSIRNVSPYSGPTVHMGGANFLQPSVTIQKGDKLMLIDDAASTHIIKNGSWVNGVAKRSFTESAPVPDLCSFAELRGCRWNVPDLDFGMDSRIISS